MRTLARYGLSVMLAGCVAQASVNGESMSILDTKMVGRTVSVDPNKSATILDWEAEGDNGVEEMCITVGTIRASFDPANPFLSVIPFPEAADTEVPDVGGTPNKFPFFVITYGIEGVSQQITVDAQPEQTLCLPATFIRIQGYNFTSATFPHLPGVAAPLRMWGMVSRAVGKVPSAARVSQRWLLTPANLRFAYVPPYARRFLIARNDAVTGAPGAITITMFDANSAIVEQRTFAAGVVVPVIELPAQVFLVQITNTSANNQGVGITWFMEP